MFRPTGFPTDTPPDGMKEMDMKLRMSYWLLMQGLGVLVLAAWVYMQHYELREYKASVRTCNEQLIQAYQDQNAKLINALEDINSTLNQLQNTSTRKRY